MTPEWSRKFAADEISATPQTMKITASPEECADLARRLRVLSIEGLAADLTLVRSSAHIIHIQGTVRARVTQSCVVTLEPVAETMEHPVEGWFKGQEEVVSLTRVRRDRMGAGTDAELPVLDEREDPEPLTDGQVDLGELAAQTLSLNLSSYPHAPGAAFDRQDDAEQAVMLEQKRPNPFESLKNWKFNNTTEK